MTVEIKEPCIYTNEPFPFSFGIVYAPSAVELLNGTCCVRPKKAGSDWSLYRLGDFQNFRDTVPAGWLLVVYDKGAK
jgi:hypothetical protein